MRTRRLVLVALAAALCGTSSLAAAAPVHPAVARGGQAGYYVSPGDVITSVQASFVAPTVTCASTAGLQSLRFGVVAPQVNATVTEYAQLLANCNDGRLRYHATVGAGGGDRGGAVAPGDSVTTTLAISPSATTATFVDHTSGRTFTITGGGQTLDRTAFIGTRPVTGETAIPTFSSPVHFSQLGVNGAKIAGFTHLREYQVHGTQVLVSATALVTNAFDLVFVANT